MEREEKIDSATVFHLVLSARRSTTYEQVAFAIWAFPVTHLRPSRAALTVWAKVTIKIVITILFIPVTWIVIVIVMLGLLIAHLALPVTRIGRSSSGGVAGFA